MINLLYKIFRPRNILILQFTLLLILFATVRLSPNISFSSLAEEYVPIVAPWIYEEHFKKSIRVNDDDIYGYVNHHSVPSGKPFKLFLSTVENWSELNGKIEVFRIGHYKNSDRKIVHKAENISVFKQQVSLTTFASGAAWKPLDNDISTSGWRSGYYAIDFIKNDGKRLEDVAFIVVTNPQQKGDILIKLSTNTYQAYNNWGGSNLYNDLISARGPADIVSFDRPTRSQFYRWEYYYVIWVEQIAQKYNLKIDYATNYDFFKSPNIANDYEILMSLGHDEYWSQEEFDAYYDRIFKQGKNTMFLGGNTAYWRIRYSDIHGSGEGRQLICYKNPLIFEGKIGNARFDPIIYTDKSESNATGLFRGKLGYPETMMMGVGYQSYFRDRSLKFFYKVKTFLPWVFEGTDLKQGDKLADVVGHEWDNTSLVWQGKPVWSREKSHIPSLNRDSLQVIFEGDVINKHGKPGHAQAVYFETDTGAKVFSAGTIRWAWGVGKPGFINKQFQKVNENLITGFLKENQGN